MTGTVGAVENFIVEDREIEGKTEAYRVCRWKLSDSHIRGSLVGLKRLVCAVFALIASGKFGQVTVIITHPRKSENRDGGGYERNLHLMIEDLGLP